MLEAIMGDTIRTQWYMLERFWNAQERDFECALQEIKKGQKQSHWIWYIFPQVKGLGSSTYSEYYGIGSREEAEAYLANNILNAHLREITQALLSHRGSRTAWEILGTIDAIKVRSCMTLFDHICPNDIFAEVLDAFYEGQRCNKTIQFLTADFCKSHGLISTGFPSLDNILGGLHPGDFVFIGSRPCMGKTSMAVNLAINILDKMNLPVLFFSLEHSSNQLRSYFRSIRTGVPIERIRKNDYSPEDNDLINEVERLHYYDQIFIDDTPCISISDIRNKGMFLVREYGVKCIILDFFGLISHVSSFNSKEYDEEMCVISHSLKEIAMKLGVPVIVFGQIERSADIRYHSDLQVPQILDLCVSTIASDADVIAFLLNHDYYRHRLGKMDNEHLGNLEVVVAQNNHGSVGDCLLRFDNKTCKIEEL